jgi:hypothetical protein
VERSNFWEEASCWQVVATTFRVVFWLQLCVSSRAAEWAETRDPDVCLGLDSGVVRCKRDLSGKPATFPPIACFPH